MKEIVAVLIGDMVTSSPKTIIAAIEHKAKMLCIDRSMAKAMFEIFGGEKWENIVNGKTLFCVDDNGCIFEPEKIKI